MATSSFVSNFYNFISFTFTSFVQKMFRTNYILYKNSCTKNWLRGQATERCVCNMCIKYTNRISPLRSFESKSMYKWIQQFMQALRLQFVSFNFFICFRISMPLNCNFYFSVLLLFVNARDSPLCYVILFASVNFVTHFILKWLKSCNENASHM